VGLVPKPVVVGSVYDFILFYLYPGSNTNCCDLQASNDT